MKQYLIVLLFFPWLGVGQESEDFKQMDLAELNEYLFVEMALNKNTEALKNIATDDYIFIGAPGIIEDKQQVINGVNNLNISSVKLSVDKIIEKDKLGIVVGVLEMKGSIMSRPVPEKIRFTSVFIKQYNMWKLQARTMTLIKM
ncbi:nuclear transport factor 2 family protein [Gramella sp. BOM4]|nr:nuclear transport factor 2 family protein [Christiangramia bathymodioli]